MSSSETKRRLEAAALESLRSAGIAGTSARSIARRADVNQALIFYHYDGVAGLIEAAAVASVDEAVAQHRSALEAAGSFAELFAAGRQLNAVAQGSGDVAVMAQLVAGAHVDPAIGACARACLDRWMAALEPTVARLLSAGPLRGLVDARGLVRAISSAFIGLELYEAVDAGGASAAAASLEQLGSILETVEGLGPVAHRAIRARLRRRSKSAGRT